MAAGTGKAVVRWRQWALANIGSVWFQTYFNLFLRRHATTATITRPGATSTPSTRPRSTRWPWTRPRSARSWRTSTRSGTTKSSTGAPASRGSAGTSRHGQVHHDRRHGQPPRLRHLRRRAHRGHGQPRPPQAPHRDHQQVHHRHRGHRLLPRHHRQAQEEEVVLVVEPPWPRRRRPARQHGDPLRPAQLHRRAVVGVRRRADHRLHDQPRREAGPGADPSRPHGHAHRDVLLQLRRVQDYLGVDVHHPLFDDIAELLREVNVAPADVAECLMTSTRAGRGVNSSLEPLIQELNKIKAKARAEAEAKASAEQGPELRRQQRHKQMHSISTSE